MQIGYEYSGFETNRGETLFGSGCMTEDKFVDTLSAEFRTWLKTALADNPKKILSLVIITDEKKELE